MTLLFALINPRILLIANAAKIIQELIPKQFKGGLGLIPTRSGCAHKYKSCARLEIPESARSPNFYFAYVQEKVSNFCSWRVGENLLWYKRGLNSHDMLYADLLFDIKLVVMIYPFTIRVNFIMFLVLHRGSIQMQHKNELDFVGGKIRDFREEQVDSDLSNQMNLRILSINLRRNLFKRIAS